MKPHSPVAVEDPASFGEWLRRRRKTLDLTQEALAARVACSVALIRKIEAGDRRPSKQIATMLAAELDIPAQDRDLFVQVARGGRPLERLTRPASFPDPSQGAPQRPSALHLPIPDTALIGREVELEQLARLLARPDCRLVTIIGPGGIGKTRLALAVAAKHRHAYRDGVSFVPLETLPVADLLVSAIGDAVGYRFSGQAEPKAQLIKYLRDKELLVVLDNAEHLLTGAPLFSELLQQVTGVKLLVTSRERLELQGEWVFDLQGLPVPAATHHLGEHTASSVTLFVESARRAQLSFALDAHNRADVARICQLVEGLPLGIELAAAWAHMLSCREIAREIEQNLNRLSTHKRGVPERHRSLQAVFDHSWGLLSPEERAALSRLSVFAGGFDRDAAEQVGRAPLGLLSALVSKSLVRRANGLAGRFVLHESVRQAAAARLRVEIEPPATSEILDVARAHAGYFLALVTRAAPELYTVKQGEWMEVLAQDLDNVRAALDWLLKPDGPQQPERVEMALELLVAVPRFWHSHDLREGRLWLERALATEAALSGRLPAWLQAKALSVAGWLARTLGDFDHARLRLNQSMVLLREVNDVDGMTYALDVLGDIAYSEGNYADAKRYYSESLALLRTRSDHLDKVHDNLPQTRATLLVAFSLSSLGNAAIELGETEEAGALFDESLQLCQRLADERGAALALYGLALVALQRDQPERGIQCLKQCLALFHKLKNKVDIALCLEALAGIAAASRVPEQGARLLGATDALLDSLGISLEANYRVRRERTLAALSVRLSEEAAAAARAAGRSLTLEQAVSEALAMS